MSRNAQSPLQRTRCGHGQAFEKLTRPTFPEGVGVASLAPKRQCTGAVSAVQTIAACTCRLTTFLFDRTQSKPPRCICIFQGRPPCVFDEIGGGTMPPVEILIVEIGLA